MERTFPASPKNEVAGDTNPFVAFEKVKGFTSSVPALASAISLLLAAGVTKEAEAAPYHNVTPEIARHLHLNAEELSKYCHLDLEVSIGPKGSYVFQIGQYHRPPVNLRGKDDPWSSIVINSQKNIEKIIESLKRNSKTSAIYSEGYGKASLLGQIKEAHALLKTKIETIPITKRGFESLKQIFDSLNVDTDKYDGLPLKILGNFYLYKKTKEFEIAMGNTNAFTDAEIDAVAQMLNELPEPSADPDTLYYIGAAERMYFEDRIDLKPAEDALVTDAVEKVYEKYVAAIVERKNYEITHPGEKNEALRILKEKEVEMEKVFAKAQETRFSAVIKWVGSSKNETLLPLVFGDGDDFVQAVQSHNTNADLQKQLGLIKCHSTVDVGAK